MLTPSQQFLSGPDPESLLQLVCGHRDIGSFSGFAGGCLKMTSNLFKIIFRIIPFLVVSLSEVMSVVFILVSR